MQVTPVNNYLVPATGTTNSVPVVGVFSAVPTRADFREVELNGVQFVPSGVFIDNSAGAAPLVISVEGMSGFTLSCPAGSRMGRQYPAPIDQICNITGNGQGIVIFVDFPVIPYDDFASANASAVTIADGADVTLGAKADAPAANDAGAFSLMAFIKRISGSITSMLGFNTPGGTGTRSDVAASIASVQILAANAGRKGAIIFNDGANNLSLLFAAGVASAANRSLVLAPGANVTLNNWDYTGVINGIWDVAAGTARVTEITA